MLESKIKNMNHQAESVMVTSRARLISYRLSVTEERDMYPRTTIEADTERRQALYRFEQESNSQLNEILSLRLALEEAQAQLPAPTLIYPEQANIPPIMEPIPAQLPEQQEEGLAINIDEFIVEPEIPDLYAQENLFNFQVGKKIRAIMVSS
jgi:hypothetical protein